MATYVTLPADNSTSWGSPARTVFASIPGLDLGAGGTADDTTTVQAALNAVSGLGGGWVLGRPNTVYTCLDVTWPSNVGIAGHGPSTVFKMKAGTVDTHALFNATGTTTATSGNVTGIGIRDCQLLGTVTTDAFVQHRHLIVLGGVTGFSSTNVLYKGWQGDGAYLGHLSGTERHNEQIRFRGNTFDGVNQDNRNAISIIDGSDVVIEGNHFLNTTRTDMPGAIDIEPNSANTWAKVAGITIRGNTFRNIRAGIAGVVSLVMQVAQASLTVPMTGLVIAGNTFVDCPNANATVFLLQQQAPTATTRKNDVIVEGNTAYNSGKPFEITGVRGVTFAGNHWENAWNGAAIGFSNVCRDVLVTGDFYDNVSGSNGITIYKATGLSMVNNDWNVAGTTQVLRFADPGGTTGASDQVDFINNRVKGTGPTAILLKDAGHTVTSTSNNRAFLNRWGGVSTAALTNVFAAGNTANNLA